MNICSGL